jgi:hypothetical protein
VARRSDIDLAWLPVHDFAEDAALIAAALEHLADAVEDEKPDFGLIGLPHSSALPGVRRKLHNLAQRTAAKREADRRELEQTLERIAGRGR